MDVVSARVHLSRMSRPVRNSIPLVYWKRVHIRTKCYRRTGLISTKRSNDAGPRDSGLDFQTERLDSLCDDVCSSLFFVGQLGILVEIASDGNNFLEDRI